MMDHLLSMCSNLDAETLGDLLLRPFGQIVPADPVEDVIPEEDFVSFVRRHHLIA